MLLTLLACTSGDITVSGIDDFGPVRTATALDVTVDNLWVVGAGALGEARTTGILLSDEAGYCDAEQGWYDDNEAAWEEMVAGRDDGDTLCDQGAAALAAMADTSHTTPRHTANLTICADGACDWDNVVPGTYDMYNPSDPYVAGSITYTTDVVSPAVGDFDEDACHTTLDFSNRNEASYTLYDLDDGTLTLDTVTVGATVKGSFEGLIYEQSEEKGTIRGTFGTDWCEIHVSTMVLL